jgi:hypothetical protein
MIELQNMVRDKSFAWFGAGQGILTLNAFVDFAGIWPILSGIIFLAVWVWRQIREDKRKQEEHERKMKL